MNYFFKVIDPKSARPMEIKFHMTTPYDWLAKICTNCYGHITKMATKHIYGKNYLNIFFSGTKTPMACTNDESRLTLTYFMARSNLIPNVFIMGKS